MEDYDNELIERLKSLDGQEFHDLCAKAAKHGIVISKGGIHTADNTGGNPNPGPPGHGGN